MPFDSYAPRLLSKSRAGCKGMTSESPPPRASFGLIIARVFLGLSLSVALVAGALSVLLRFQAGLGGGPLPGAAALNLFPATGGVIPPEHYGQIFTLHGTGMFFFVLLASLQGVFALLAFGPERYSFSPRIRRLLVAGVSTHGLALAFLSASPFFPGDGPAAGWSVYPPLSQLPWSPGWGVDLFLLALTLWGFGALMTNAATVLVIVGLISENPSLRALKHWNPYQFGHGLASASAILAIPSLLLAMLLQLSDRRLGTTFFQAGTGSPLLHQHLFWFFGHPAVYMLILPVMGFFTGVLDPSSSMKSHGLRTVAHFCMAAIATLGFAAWGHHMFQAGLDPRVSGSFSLATLLISWPSALLVGIWLLWAVRFPGGRVLPEEAGSKVTLRGYGQAFLITFAAGGLGGVLLATAPLNAHLHETYWIVGHIHLVLFGGTVLGLSALLFKESGVLFGGESEPGLIRGHLLLTVPLLLLTFGAMHVMGYVGVGRRMYSLEEHGLAHHFQWLNRVAAYGAFALATTQLLIFGSILGSCLRWPWFMSRALTVPVVLGVGWILGMGWLGIVGTVTGVQAFWIAAGVLLWLFWVVKMIWTTPQISQRSRQI